MYICTTLMKENIIHTATELFLNQGFKSVTMDEIAQELTMSKKTLYQHYNNKETIVAVVVDQLFENICSVIDDICALKANPIKEVYEIKKQVMHHLKDEASAPMHQLQKYYPKIYNSLKARQFHYMQECVVANIKRGLDEGLFRPNINVEFVSRIYFNGVTGIKDSALFPTSMFGPKEIFENFLEYHLRGIVTPKGRTILNNLIHSTED